MRRIWQVWQSVVCLALLSPMAGAGEFEWQPLTISRSAFSTDIGLLPSEREEYADQLAVYAAGQLLAGKGSEMSLIQARKVLALALNLSPRNKQAMVLNFQLGNGVLPEKGGSESDTEALAKLLFARAQQLVKQDGDENQKLSRIFTQLAAEMDPKNVDVVYTSEINRLDHGPVDWNALIQSSK